MDENSDRGDHPRGAGAVVALLLDDLSCTDNETNRQASLRCERLVGALEMARRHPEVYTPDADPVMAERSAVLDIALRLRLSEDQVRELQSTAGWAMRHLPELWAQARDGFASMTAVRQVVTLLHAIVPPADAPQEIQDAATAVIARVDVAAAAWVLTCPSAAFRRRVKKLIDAVSGDLAARRHTRAMADRKVVHAPAGDGMSWISALVPTHEAVAIFGRLTATAKNLQKDKREGRTRDQIRTDLFIGWLKGTGTPTAVKTKIFVTVPVQLLAGQPVPIEQASIVGGDTLDPLSARQLFLEAKTFRRLITDPVDGVFIDMDRRTYRPTKAQRDWITVRHGTCSRDGCSRLAVDADIDHDRPWARGGETNLANLRPLCPRDHAHRHRTRAVFRTRPDRTVEVTTPTGFVSDAPPPF
ncbi:DUF222 domain-containing protein [Microbacterium sp. PMB16]|uniref:HNH endonuclease signature motif containing protein n=1 Tax=Microbacterium sp. PMB16 TaxID=3120157 RepID=UPI003F4B7E75